MKPTAYVVLGALLYVAGYPAGLGIWICSCVALVPLLVCVERYALSTRRALGLGALFSMTSQLIGYAFLPETLLRFSGLPWLACLAARQDHVLHHRHRDQWQHPHLQEEIGQQMRHDQRQHRVGPHPQRRVAEAEGGRAHCLRRDHRRVAADLAATLTGAGFTNTSIKKAVIS